MRLKQIAMTLIAFACLVPGLHADDSVDDTPRAFIEDWAAAFNENSPKKQAAFYDRSEKTEVLVSSGLRHQGYEAVHKAYQDDQKQLRYYDSKATNVSTRILGVTALVTFEHQFKIHFLADDSRWKVHIRTTSVLHRVDNEWKIVLEHSSSIRDIDRMTQLTD